MIIPPKLELSMHVTTPGHSLKLLFHWHRTTGPHPEQVVKHLCVHFSKCLRKENPRSRSSREEPGEQTEQCLQTEVQLSRRPTVHLAKPLYLLIFESPNQNHTLQDAIPLSPCQTKQPNISISFLSASPSSCFAADQWTWAGVTTHMLVLGMLYHKQNLLFHCKRKFLKFNFLMKFIFNDQTLSNIMYTCTQQEFLLGKKNLWKESWSK